MNRGDNLQIRHQNKDILSSKIHIQNCTDKHECHTTCVKNLPVVRSAESRNKSFPSLSNFRIQMKFK